MPLTVQVTPFPISDLFPDDMSHFYRYNGSLTTPSCDEIVQVPPPTLHCSLTIVHA